MKTVYIFPNKHTLSTVTFENVTVNKGRDDFNKINQLQVQQRPLLNSKRHQTFI